MKPITIFAQPPGAAKELAGYQPAPLGVQAIDSSSWGRLIACLPAVEQDFFNKLDSPARINMPADAVLVLE
jgi:hypothetical protein